MDPEKLEATIKSKAQEKHPSYQAPILREQKEESHILRFVVTKSEVMSVGGVVVVDARDGGVQVGRDRCEKGGQGRVRIKEMEVSKTHAVVYWGRPGDQVDEGWSIVDLGA